MSDEYYDAFKEFSEQLFKKKVTNEEALQSLIRAGIVDENGKLLPPYEGLHEILMS